MAELERRTLAFQRGEVEKLLSQCTPKQQAFFGKLYPGGVNSLSGDKLLNAYDQCARTVRRNTTPPAAEPGAERSE